MTRDSAPDSLDVEVVYATAERQELVALTVPPGTTASEAIELSAIRDRFPDLIDTNASIGVWGRVTGGNRQLKDGDRVEIYRELVIDPREARRLLAEQGRSMNQGEVPRSSTGSDSIPGRRQSR